jgi:phosphoglycerate kinase
MINGLKGVTELKGSLAGKRVLVRADFNVPLGNDGVVDPTEAWRIQRALPTLEFLRNEGARIIVVSHLGREGESLKPVASYMQQFFQIGFSPTITGHIVEEQIEQLPHGGAILLENIRREEGEKSNDPELARQLADYADIYVNEAFPVCHREHASIVGIPKLLPHYAGMQLMQELEAMDSLRINPPKPLLVVLAGAKFGTKLDLVRQFLPVAEYVVVAGALPNKIFQLRGLEIGQSIVDDSVDIEDLVHNEKILLPKDVTVERAGEHVIVLPGEVLANDTIMDAGPATIQAITDLARQSQAVLWNGPLGNYEAGFPEQTIALAKALAEVEAKTIVGGGDTVAVLAQHKIIDQFDFVSTGGGAMLDYLVDGELPGVEALKI